MPMVQFSRSRYSLDVLRLLRPQKTPEPRAVGPDPVDPLVSVASSALAGDRQAQPPRAPAPPSAARPARRRSAKLAPSPWEAHFGLRYAASWTGDELGLFHGPGLAAGARFGRGASIGLELGADRRFAQTLSTPALDASIERSTLYALLEVGLALSPSQSAFVALGPALELSRTRP